MSSILDTILESTHKRVAAARRITNVGDLTSRAFAIRSAARAHALRSAIENGEGINIIAEFKRASPSKGIIDDQADPFETARNYEADGACAISVLTEPDYFHGSLEDLSAVRKAVSIPILRKDFIVDECQIYEAAVAGADAVLLIVAALDIEILKRFRLRAHELGMDALIEVHDADEIKTAVDIGADLIGVNNRNLRTFEVSLDVSRELIRLAPPSALMISESGLTTRHEIFELRSLGYSAFLIGEAVMRTGSTLMGTEMLP